MASKGHLHFLGIAGHAMRGIALAARQLGYEVTGTDAGAKPPGSTWLDEQGFTWFKEADPAHLDGVDTVIISGHTQADDTEVKGARQKNISIKSFAELAYDLTKDARRIMVAGTHGKTTTTSLITWILESAGRKPDFLIGIQPHNFDSSVRLQGSKLAVIEGDEYRASQLDQKSKFEYYRPDSLVLTSLEMDHPDFFTDFSDIEQRFTDLVQGLPQDGQLTYWAGSPEVRAVAETAKAQKQSYGLSDADWTPDDINFTPAGLSFQLRHHDERLGELQVPLYGQHNVLNVLAAAAVTLGEGVSIEQLQEALRSFKGASRRFERVSRPDAAVTVLDDYAHHPTEVKTTIEAAKLHFPGRVLVLFRPHTYSRTRELLKEYHQAFGDADLAYIAEIESAREAAKEKTVSGADIAAKAGEQVHYEEDRAKILDALVAEAKPGDTVLCMTVNGFDDFAAELANRLEEG